jgi:formiminoglutamase
VNPVHARQFVSYAGGDSKTAYLHICEGGAKQLNSKSSETTGKLVCYLVSDFMKATE